MCFEFFRRSFSSSPCLIMPIPLVPCCWCMVCWLCWSDPVYMWVEVRMSSPSYICEWKSAQNVITKSDRWIQKHVCVEWNFSFSNNKITKTDRIIKLKFQGQYSERAFKKCVPVVRSLGSVYRICVLMFCVLFQVSRQLRQKLWMPRKVNSNLPNTAVSTKGR